MALNPRKITAPDTWDGDWSKLPGTLNARHMAAICGVGVDCIWDRCQARRMRPRPIAWMRPYRWLKASVEAELSAGAVA